MKWIMKLNEIIEQVRGIFFPVRLKKIYKLICSYDFERGDHTDKTIHFENEDYIIEVVFHFEYTKDVMYIIVTDKQNESDKMLGYFHTNQDAYKKLKQYLEEIVKKSSPFELFYNEHSLL